MNMSLSRRLAEAVGSWLHFEFCCYRAGLFSESSLKAAVGQVLSSFPVSAKGVRVYADFPHDALNRNKKSGRKKEVDFALILSGDGLKKENAEVLVETKWANSSHSNPKNIFSDFLRLAALKRVDSSAKCIFLLAGHVNDMKEVMGGMPFLCNGRRNTGVGVGGKNRRRVTPDSSNLDHLKYFGSAIKKLLASGIEVPKSFVVMACDAHPIQSVGETIDFQAKSWEVVEVSGECIDKKLWP